MPGRTFSLIGGLQRPVRGLAQPDREHPWVRTVDARPLDLIEADRVKVLTFTAGPLHFGWFGPNFLRVRLASVAVVGIALAVVDVRSFRLPDRLIGLALMILAVSLVAAAITDGHWAQLRGSGFGAAALGASYLILAVVQPGQIGLGDVKLAVLLGMVLGWFGWQFVLWGGCLAFLLSAVTLVALLVLRRITLRGHVPFGPFMLVGAAAALLF